MRLDLYLVEKGLAESRARAKRLIEAGHVMLDGRVVEKPALDVVGDPAVTVVAERFVSRGGEKLAGALEIFGIDVRGLRALDIGASTGGFTDCLLQNGAAHVVALDTGFGQLHPKLLSDPRVTNIEKYTARALRVADVGEVDLAVMDVSFISQTYILPNIPPVLKDGGSLVALIKPQFEAGRGALNKNGIVKDQRDQLFAVHRVISCAAEAGLSCVGLAPSPILGGDGNREFLAYYQKKA
ncbi:MAG: TlyA family RNA methyltransferase, partial [Oscillospiraceae bacterium]|nr:TlyA family RNA methyltransferase [Oscillospiraceae bacterium]